MLGRERAVETVGLLFRFTEKETPERGIEREGVLPTTNSLESKFFVLTKKIFSVVSNKYVK